jgi:predicted dehydrogenase
MTGGESLRFGCIGMGSHGRRLSEQVREQPDASLVAIVDPDDETRAEAGEELDVAPEGRFVDSAAMFETAGLDAVMITTPPGLHYDDIVAAFERDCHVLCEKPLVTELEDAEDLVARDDATDLTFMVGYQRHLNPGYRFARDRWDGERKPHFVTGELTQDWRHHYEDTTGWRTDPDLGGGGHVFSVGTHVLDAILWTTDLTPETVTARMQFADDAERIDEQATITIEFEEGSLAQLSDSGLTPATKEHVHAWDDEKALYFEGTYWSTPRLTVIDGDGEHTEPDLDYEGAPSKVEAFCTAIREGSEPPATARDGLRVTAVLEAAYRSVETDAPASVRL